MSKYKQAGQLKHGKKVRYKSDRTIRLERLQQRQKPGDKK